MAPPLAELTAQAQTLTSAGDLVGARDVLDDVLRAADSDPRRATADLAVAAALFARVLIALGDAESARLWAAFAHSAEERLHGPRDERTIAAAATHAAVLQRIGQHGRATMVYSGLVAELARADGPDSPRVLAADADLATSEHAAGQCATARARLARAWRHHRDVYGEAAPAGIKMLARLGAMERECGHDAESGEHLALARDLAGRHLPADHPLARQTARLVTGKASGRHTCATHEPTGETPFRPFPRRPTVPDPAPTPGDRPGSVFDPVLPTPAHQPLYRSDAHRPAPSPALPSGTTSASTSVDLPDPRRLPVRAEQPEHRRGLHPAVLAAVLVAGVAAAVTVVLVTLPDTGGPAELVAPTTAAPPPATRSVPATTGDAGAPQNVRLSDDGGSVTLLWTYPSGANGPVLISGGRTGDPPRKFQELPGGAGDFVVYSLNERLDYCFTVAVEYAPDRIATSAPVCTSR